MLKNFKNNIKELAYSAVNYAENALTTSSGQAKKKEAIAYLVGKLVLPPMLKPFVILLFSSFIDEAIETAVVYMHKVRNEE